MSQVNRSNPQGAPPAIRRALLTLLALSVGCSSSTQRRSDEASAFPAVNAERRLVGSDTLSSVNGTGYQLLSPAPTLLPRAKVTLDALARAYRRYFTDEPPTVVVILDTLPSAAVPNDSAGARTIHIAVPRAAPAPKARPGDVPPRPEPNVAPIVAHAWLSARMDQRVAAPAAPTSSTRVTPTTRFGMHPDDPRVPDWIEDGVLGLMTRGQGQDFVYAMLARQSSLIPLDSLFRMHRPGAAGVIERPADAVTDDGMVGRGGYDRRGMSGGSRTAPKLEPSMLYESQSIGVAQFLADREGPAFVGSVVDALASGASVQSALSRARMLPTDKDGLERAWRLWLSSFASNSGRR